MRINSARLISRKNGTLERNDKTSNDSLKQFAVAKRKIARACRNSQSSKPRLSYRKASFPKSTGEFRRLCSCDKDADYRKCMQEHSRFDETMKNVGQRRNWTSENPRNDAAAKAGASGLG